jgi:hypothetical protein
VTPLPSYDCDEDQSDLEDIKECDDDDSFSAAAENEAKGSKPKRYISGDGSVEDPRIEEEIEETKEAEEDEEDDKEVGPFENAIGLVMSASQILEEFIQEKREKRFPLMARFGCKNQLIMAELYNSKSMIAAAIKCYLRAEEFGKAMPIKDNMLMSSLNLELGSVF